MRTLAFLFVLVQFVLLGPLYLLYGQVDPCRALAAELASRTGDDAGFIERLFQSSDAEITARRDVADRSTLQCTTGLVQSWGERIGM